ncbi:MAG: hypothetical protein CMF23_00045 [Ignavibacteriae bacterium]|nr:hypothetical protein [Ignavibacteriota bacterium]
MRSNYTEVIECPKCGEQIKLTEALIGHIESDLKKTLSEENNQKIEQAKKEAAKKALEERENEFVDLRNQLAEKQTKIDKLNSKELELNKKARELEEKENSITNELEKRLNSERTKLIAQGREQATKNVTLEVQDLKEQLNEATKRVENLTKKELDLRKEKRELENARKELELEKQREIDSMREEIYKQAKNESDVDYKLKIRERDEQLKQMNKKIEELQRKAEQGSQQLQGEAQELELEDFLKYNFPLDDIEPIAKGQKGADIIQKVKNEFGAECGIILWESKRTKDFGNKWIAKLKEDQRETKANIAVIITEVLPENINNFGVIDGVWVGSFQSTLGIATALRENLIQIFNLRQSEVGKNQKMDALYGYLTSHEFAQRIESIIEAFDALEGQIKTERKAFEKQWNERAKLLSQVMKNTVGLHGDLKGIIGKTLPEIEGLSLEDKSSFSELNLI